MARFLPDTGVIVGAVCEWHEHHAAALEELERRLTAGDSMVVAGPTLVEAYAVLTRLPAPYRLSAGDAHALVSANFVRDSEVGALDGPGYVGLLERAATHGIAGGQTYDAVVAECARNARVDVLITFNERHFRRVADQAISVVVPS